MCEANPALQDLVKIWLPGSSEAKYWLLDENGPWPGVTQFVATSGRLQKGYIKIYQDRIEGRLFTIYGGHKVVLHPADPLLFEKLESLLKSMSLNPKCTTCGCEPCVCGLTTW